ncbi:MAG TPA: F0F1 ATP synthase subunit gamma, partial [Stellaceae bacterium]|nr:F0F1 ATP synthase subunit gamma [Stellaceae bacterium]
MTRLAQIQSQIAGIDELLDIVGAMRSLAGMRIQEAQRSLPAIRRYAEAMAGAIGAALRLIPEPPPEARAPSARRALVLCTAEHGFVGGFNERLAEAAGPLSPADSLF